MLLLFPISQRKTTGADIADIPVIFEKTLHGLKIGSHLPNRKHRRDNLKYASDTSLIYGSSTSVITSLPPSFSGRMFDTEKRRREHTWVWRNFGHMSFCLGGVLGKSVC